MLPLLTLSDFGLKNKPKPSPKNNKFSIFKFQVHKDEHMGVYYDHSLFLKYKQAAIS